jgi:NDP-sugar pyrophosphorylase family protein
MVLAAGLGTRLRPLTNDRPKALVEINGKTLLEITVSKLKSAGVTQVIVNVHHYAQMVADYLRAHNNFGLRIEVSREDDTLLDTGGGLKKAAWFFQERQPVGEGQPFFLHNVDVISSIDLNRMMETHQQSGCLATLAVQARESSRQLLFDDRGELCGRRKVHEANEEIVRPARNLRPLAFAGIHAISPRLLRMFTEDDVFSIIDAYLRFAASGETIQAFRADSYYWRDLGKPENIQQAACELQQGEIS